MSEDKRKELNENINLEKELRTLLKKADAEEGIIYIFRANGTYIYKGIVSADSQRKAITSLLYCVLQHEEERVIHFDKSKSDSHTYR